MVEVVLVCEVDVVVEEVVEISGGGAPISEGKFSKSLSKLIVMSFTNRLEAFRRSRHCGGNRSRAAWR